MCKNTRSGFYAITLSTFALPADVTVDSKSQHLGDKGGNLLNENSAFESRWGEQEFFPAPDFCEQIKMGFSLMRTCGFAHSKAVFCGCLLPTWVSSWRSGWPRRGWLWDCAPAQLYWESLWCLEGALSSSGCAAVCVCRELAVEEVASLRLIWRGEQDEEKNCPYDWLGE